MTKSVKTKALSSSPAAEEIFGYVQSGKFYPVFAAMYAYGFNFKVDLTDPKKPKEIAELPATFPGNAVLVSIQYTTNGSFLGVKLAEAALGNPKQAKAISLATGVAKKTRENTIALPAMQELVAAYGNDGCGER